MAAHTGLVRLDHPPAAGWHFTINADGSWSSQRVRADGTVAPVSGPHGDFGKAVAEALRPRLRPGAANLVRRAQALDNELCAGCEARHYSPRRVRRSDDAPRRYRSALESRNARPDCSTRRGCLRPG